jgi:hypothetical protein
MLIFAHKHNLHSNYSHLYVNRCQVDPVYTFLKVDSEKFSYLANTYISLEKK